MALMYHNGALLEGDLPKSIVVDSLLSLDSQTAVKSPSVSHWWKIVRTYLKKAGKKETQVVLSNQDSDEACSAGKLLKKSTITELAQRVNSKPSRFTLALTAQDAAVEGFCTSNCGFHGSDSGRKSVFVWVGNSVTQCPGQCAWPFHQPIYGPKTKALSTPNGDVGVDGMITHRSRQLRLVE
ncbi:Phosphate-induced protein [Parasponia andersonii]|uniref:Phosphate-induced protein n=1 Tax=Parasponia andersonii TaxID=3476 RepID=A0A2P5BF66_PARAD|nr:Phosphate-induced protein [Parasponia andersonii]